MALMAISGIMSSNPSLALVSDDYVIPKFLVPIKIGQILQI